MAGRLAQYTQKRRARASAQTGQSLALLGQRRAQIHQSIQRKREEDFIKSQQETASRKKKQGGAIMAGAAIAGAVTGAVAAGAVAGGMSAATGAVVGGSIGSSIGSGFATGGQTQISAASIGYAMNQMSMAESNSATIDLDKLADTGSSADELTSLGLLDYGPEYSEQDVQNIRAMEHKYITSPQPEETTGGRIRPVGGSARPITPAQKSLEEARGG